MAKVRLQPQTLHQFCANILWVLVVTNSLYHGLLGTHVWCYLGKYKKLVAGAVPSVFPFQQVTARSQRFRRGTRKVMAVDPVPQEVSVTDSCEPDPTHIGSEITVQSTETTTLLTENEPVSLCMTHTCMVDSVIQCSLLSDDVGFSIQQFVDRPHAIKYFTGFDNYDHFRYFLSVLGPASRHLSYKFLTMSVEDHLFMTLIKLRLAKDDTELGILFKISQKVVGKIYQVWLNFMYFQLKELNIWPSQSVVQQHMPLNFGRQFGTTRVILDATECAIEKPTNIALQSSTFSSYKNCNTVKTVLGITPHGAVSFISDTYGGSASDRQILERSALCSEAGMFQKGDSIMADRGIMVQDLFASKNVLVNTPHMLRGKSQLQPEEVIHDRRIASKRIHVERVIGLAKTFKILQKKLSIKRIQDAHKIIFVCFNIVNFRNCIVGPYA